MGGGADGEDPGGTPPPEDVAGIDLDPEQHSKDEPEPDPVAAHGTADAQSESIGTEDSASEDDGDANEHEHDLEDGYEPIYESEDGFEQMMQDNADPAGVPWPGIPDEWSDDDSGESDAESGQFSYDDSDMSGFDEDAMHFEIEGTTQGANRVRDPEERGHYLLHDGRVPSSHTGMNHQQGSDSVCAAGDGLLLVTGDVDVRLVDANAIVSDGAYDADGKFNEPDPDGPGPVRKSPDGPDGAEYVASTPEYVAKQELPFSVYSVDYDEASRLVAVCGDVRRYAQDVNLAVFRVVHHRTSAPGRASSASFVPVAERGVGAMGRFGRDMVNCVRFGKRVKASDGVHLDGVHRLGGKRAIEDVLLCASQDGNCYVMSVDVKDHAGVALEALGDDDDDAWDGAGFSPGGQGGRGPRRRPRLDARLVECCKIAFPVASNAAAAPPDGSCVSTTSPTASAHFSAGVSGTSARKCAHASEIVMLSSVLTNAGQPAARAPRSRETRRPECAATPLTPRRNATQSRRTSAASETSSAHVGAAPICAMLGARHDLDDTSSRSAHDDRRLPRRDAAHPKCAVAPWQAPRATPSIASTARPTTSTRPSSRRSPSGARSRTAATARCTRRGCSARRWR